MEPEQALWIFLGIFSLICGAGLFFVKVDKEQLEKKAHSNPGFALYRYKAWRWGVALTCTALGLILVLVGFNK